MKGLKVYDTIIFDLDGTLLNTLDDLHCSTNYALKQLGFPERSKEEIKCFLGNGNVKLIERAVPEGTDEVTQAACLARFREYYGEHMEDLTAPYPGIIHLLADLRKLNVKTAVVSNKYSEAVKRLCLVNFPNLIDVVIGDMEGVRLKPAPDCVLMALEGLQSSKGRTLYVGDSDVDMETARNVGITSIGVTWGYRSEERLLAAGADYLATKPDDIWEIFRGTF